MPVRVMLLLLATAMFIAIWSGDKHEPAATTVLSEKEQPCCQSTARQSTKISNSLTASLSEKIFSLREFWNDMQLSLNQFAERVRSHLVRKIEKPSQWQSWWAWLDEGTLLTDERSVAVAARKPSHVRQTSEKLPIDHRQPAERNIPLPRDLTPGEFRIVNSDGLSHRLSFSPAELAAHGIPAVVPPRNLYVFKENGVRWYFIRIEKNVLPLLATVGEATLRSTISPKSDLKLFTRLVNIPKTWFPARESVMKWKQQLTNTVQRNVVSPWRRSVMKWSNTSFDKLTQIYKSWFNSRPRISTGKKPTRLK